MSGLSRHESFPGPSWEYSAWVSMHHTDAGGRIYVAAPSDWAQIGSEGLVRALGHPIEDRMGANIHYPLVKLEVDHRRALSLGQEITVRTGVESVGNRSWVMRSDIVDGDGELAVVVRRTAVAVARDESTRPGVDQWIREAATP